MRDCQLHSLSTQHDCCPAWFVFWFACVKSYSIKCIGQLHSWWLPGNNRNHCNCSRRSLCHGARDTLLELVGNLGTMLQALLWQKPTVYIMRESLPGIYLHSSFYCFYRCLRRWVQIYYQWRCMQKQPWWKWQSHVVACLLFDKFHILFSFSHMFACLLLLMLLK